MRRGLETKESLLGRVRQRLNAAKQKSGLSWERIYKYCDSDGNGILDIDELRYAVRSANILRVSEHTVNEHELLTFFNELDADNSGGVALAEVLEYLQRGPRNPEEELARKETKVARVKKTLSTSFLKLGSESTIRQAFADADRDSEGKLSYYEFETFVRQRLKLTQWDVKGPDLENFYTQLDSDGDGLEVDELLNYIRDRPLKDDLKTKYAIKKPRLLSHREKLLREAAVMNDPTPVERTMQLRPSSSFSNLGRSKMALTRLPVSLTTGLLQVDPGYARPHTTGAKGLHKAASGPL
jgi:Ca2+-binding EF-hand superfamily protein